MASATPLIFRSCSSIVDVETLNPLILTSLSLLPKYRYLPIAMIWKKSPVLYILFPGASE